MKSFSWVIFFASFCSFAFACEDCEKKTMQDIDWSKPLICCEDYALKDFKQNGVRSEYQSIRT
jgi:hypothetical protein